MEVRTTVLAVEDTNDDSEEPGQFRHVLRIVLLRIQDNCLTAREVSFMEQIGGVGTEPNCSFRTLAGFGARWHF